MKKKDDSFLENEESELTGDISEAAEGTSELDLGSEVIADPEDAEPSDLTPEQIELQAQRDKYLRLAAEYDNYRKRTTREVLQAAEAGQGDLLKKLLDSLDDLARFTSVEVQSEDAQALLEGVILIEKNISKVLESIGVKVINPLNEPFDPNVHEALTTQPAESPEQDHTVAQVYQRGYQLRDSLLRPARVVVYQA